MFCVGQCTVEFLISHVQNTGIPWLVLEEMESYRVVYFFSMFACFTWPVFILLPLTQASQAA